VKDHLDHRGQTYTRLLDQGIAKFNTRKEAERFAKSFGWLVGDVAAAANRFHYYWVVCQCVGDSAHYLARGGKVIRDEWPGYLKDNEVP
jgi:hypothetical protein